MRILVIGGTYFLGRAFVEIASEENELLLINRGNSKVRFSYPGHVRQIKADRHHLDEKEFSQESFDVVVDFCAYQGGDIAELMKAIGGRTKQYIFVSTSDVYQRGTGCKITESSPLEFKDYGGPAGEYILGKVILERELVEVSEKYQISYNSVRPVFIYGPNNYANRESVFFQWAEQMGQVLYPEDATGHFQMVYVEDAAKVIMQLCLNEACKNKSINICTDQCVTYESFTDAVSYAVNRSLEKVSISVEDVRTRKIPLPFPLTKEESETYTSLYGHLLHVNMTSLRDGLRHTYEMRQKQMVIREVDAYFDENKPKEAEEYMLHMRLEAKKSGSISLELTLLNELIGYYRQTSKKDELLAVIEDSFAIFARIGGEDSLDYATTALNAANAYRSIGKLKEAEKYYTITRELYRKFISTGQLESDDLLVAGLENNLSLFYQELGNFQEAKVHLKEALQIVTTKKAGFEIAVTYANLANTCVLAGQFDEAREYAYTAIRLFRARALKDSHYSAALSALGICYLEEGKADRAEKLFREAMEIVEKTLGRNRQYERLQENLLRCEKMRQKEKLSGMELAREYYKVYGENMIAEKFSDYAGKIAVGLAGEGSDCYGFDDELSADHDFGPDLCLWVSDETYEKIGEALERAYDNLPKSYAGYTRVVSPQGKNRRGVIRISDFYKKFLGTDIYEQIDYTTVEDYALSACVNGEVFRDDEGIFGSMRRKLKAGYPENIRFLKIAEEAAGFSQCAQYNYLRMLQREDEVTAQIMLTDGIKHVMKLCHYMNNIYAPHDKWLYKSTKTLPETEEIVTLIDQIMNQFLCKTDKKDVAESIEKLGAVLAEKMYEAEIISDVNPYLDYHTEEILFKAGIIELTREELTDRIVKLEFEAFDKVKNEGGRAYCQNDWPTFSVMRKSQYLTWNKNMLVQYFYDFTREYNLGHNLITEKYGRMMESTAKEKWNAIKDHFPQLSEEKKAIIEQIVGVQMQMMEEFAKLHPKAAQNARTLHTYEDSVIDTSYETYLRGEISTYSDKMLQLYGRYVVNSLQNNKNIAYATMENTAKLYGYKDFEEFEKEIYGGKKYGNN